MGCDIHGWVEEKVGDKWVSRSDFGKTDEAGNRNYTRFARLAGVRGNGPVPRGFPADAGERTKHEFTEWGQDAHSPSWMFLPRALAIFTDTMGNGYHRLPRTPWEEKFPGDYFFGVPYPSNNFRIVFWFDN